MSKEQEQTISEKPLIEDNSINNDNDKESITGQNLPVINQPTIEEDPDLEPESEIKQDSGSGEIILEADFSGEKTPSLKIRVSEEMLTRAAPFLKKRGRVLKIVGGVVAIGTAAIIAGTVVKKHLKKRKEAQPIPPLSEEQIAEFTQIYEKHVDRIYSYIYFRVGNAQDAEDLTAKVFENALRKFPEFRPLPDLEDPVRSWLFRIAHNLLVNFLERRKPEVPLEDRHPSPEKSPEELTEEEEDKVRLREVICSLPDVYQLVLYLKHVEGFTNEEIGEVLGKTEGAIKSLYHRILVKLREKPIAG